MNEADLKDYERIQAVINTLPLLECLPHTRNNDDHMLGIYNQLELVRDHLIAEEQQKEKEAAGDGGEDHAE